jgi:putative heme-binding domain-containing protein
MPQDLRGLFSSESPRAVRAAALKPLLQMDPDWMRAYLEEHITELSIGLREAAMAACGSNPSDANWLLDCVAAGSIPKTVIDPTMAKRLRQHPDATVAAKAEKLLRSDPDRARVLSEYKVASQDLGDPEVGRRLFTEHCSACHHIDGVGTNVGPDISDTRTKTAESLLVSILDPNAAIDSSFVQYQILTVDGRVLDGLLIDETADAVTLQQKGGERITIAREEMDRMRSPGVSLMPEGFERSLDQQAMSHLLSYLKNWRYLKTSIPGTLPE